ncbi:CxxH/CxxC protein [Clostridium sp.]|uniref:CxxH/CxxC protein n=1 Tax=Clostridium sp. TaxID=1506 RepID=UPI0025BB15B3|nr:CxxH/CxxC protein [Clostridium sp.]
MERRILKISKQTKYSCNDHIDIAIDDFLVENETFPYMFYVDNQCSKPKCSYCSKDAVYILKLKP